MMTKTMPHSIIHHIMLHKETYEGAFYHVSIQKTTLSNSHSDRQEHTILLIIIPIIHFLIPPTSPCSLIILSSMLTAAYRKHACSPPTSHVCECVLRNYTRMLRTHELYQPKQH